VRARRAVPASADGPPSLTLADGVATIRLSRPSAHNRIDPDDVPLLQAQLEAVDAEPSARVLVITGTGTRTFSSGYTVDAIVGRLDRRFEDMLDQLERFRLPTIAALNGSVYGGATDLALCCDVRIGVIGSRMFMPAARFGLHYYPGGLRRYVNVLGLAQAKRLFLTAQTIDAGEMLRIGFLTERVAPARLHRRVADYVEALLDCEPGVVQSMKRQLDAIAGHEPGAAHSRDDYERSLRSQALAARLAGMPKRR
jgi:enoyl-CoA hydratase/carnithine racemase